jgi:RNA polymerase sigma-70 factor (ECF subfamily)
MLGRGNATSLETEGVSVELEAMLLDVIASARQVFPTIDLPTETYVSYLAERLPAGQPLQYALHQAYTVDLYLACACARGDASALAAFEDRCLRHIDGALSRLGVDADVSAEIKQEIRRRVLIGDGEPAQIVGYSGRGDLRSWVRVIATREALQRRRRTRRDVQLEDDALIQHFAPGDNPETEYLKGLYREKFKRSFEGALKTLSHRERTLLRQHYIDGLTIDEIGRLYRMHRSTASRLVARVRSLVLETTRAEMMSQLDVEPHELDSILRLIRSQIEISLRVLRRDRTHQRS